VLGFAWLVALAASADIAPRERSAGASLAAARALERAGDLAGARESFAGLAAREPLVADLAEFEAARIAAVQGDREGARVLAERWIASSTPLGADFDALIAELAAAAGDREAAIAALDRGSRRATQSERRAELALRAAAQELAAGRRDAAARRYVALWRDRPAAKLAATVESELASIEASAGRAFRSASDYRLRGDACFDANRNEAALAAYDEVLRRRDAAPRDRARAAAQRAETLFRLRRYADAVGAYAALPPKLDARIGWARSIARSGDPLRGAKELAALAARNRGESAERARWLAASLYAGEADLARAKPLFDALANKGRSEYAREARWQLAWSEFAAGRYANAAKRLSQVAAETADPLDALRARYWRSRALERAGSAEFSALDAELARSYPLSYYGWRAGLRLAATPDASLAARPSAGLETGVGRARLPESEFERARILLEAGYSERVRELLPQLASRARSRGDRLRLAQLATDADAYHEAQSIVVDAYAERLARGPAGDSLELWWHAWPAPHADWVRGSVIAETARGLPAELVYAIMREESGYRPAVISISGARGLLQLMPETARRVAEGVALPGFREDDLFEPRFNIRLGAAYLAELLQRFDGRLSAAIASYNAGPEAVSRWLAASSEDDDVFVESIPYDQTRAYVKRVLRSMHAYRVLY
jgi:soluble lytic murein transglycosylase